MSDRGEGFSIISDLIQVVIFIYLTLLLQVHKKLGNTHFALMNFSWAMDLDPKGINNQIKEAIDKRYVTEDDESLARLNDTGNYLNINELAIPMSVLL